MALKAYALTTVSRLAQFMGITPNATQEAILENIINQATEFIENEIGFRVKKTTHSNELVDGDESGIITLKNRPVISSESITVGYRTSQLNEDNWETLDSENYVVDYEAGQIMGMGNYKFRGGRGLFRVSYTAGYDFNNTSTFLTDTEAGDLELACWKLCADAFNQRRGSQGVQSESIGDYSVTFMKTSWDDSEIKGILDKYSGFDLPDSLTPYHY